MMRQSTTRTPGKGIALLVAVLVTAATPAGSSGQSPRPSPAGSAGPAGPADPAKAARVQAKAASLVSNATAIRNAGSPADKEFTQAIEFMEKAVAKGYDTVDLRLLLGRAYLNRNREKSQDLALAEQSLQKSVALGPSAQAYFELGRAQGLAGRKPEEVKSYEKALELEPEWAACHMALSKAYSGSGLPDAEKKMLEHSKAATRLDPKLRSQAEEAIRGSDTMHRVKGLVNEIINKSEDDKLTDKETEKYAEQFRKMMGK
ncbi:MAG: hypothetical protein HY815_31465 [Candidatus Riflebacteria bacterium]|nr:hypothetical protein [Candidatus Riflebacteria bacterium]